MTKESPYYVYVLRNPQGQLYIGSTDDLDRRVQQHQQGEARWTRDRGPWTLVLAESFQTRADAMCRERKLKRGRANQQLRAQIDEQAEFLQIPERQSCKTLSESK